MAVARIRKVTMQIVCRHVVVIDYAVGDVAVNIVTGGTAVYDLIRNRPIRTIDGIPGDIIFGVIVPIERNQGVSSDSGQACWRMRLAGGNRDFRSKWPPT